MMINYIEKLKSVMKGKFAIFIDAANLEWSVKKMWVNPKDIPDELKQHASDQLCWRVDYGKFKEFFESFCSLSEIYFYAPHFETDSQIKFFYFLKKGLQFHLATKPLKQYQDHTAEKPHRKANFDVELAVDATFSMNQYDTFILFSGDCDFEYLLKFLRGNGKQTIVFSRSGNVAKELPPACHHYFDLVDFRHEILCVKHKAKNPPSKTEDPAVDVT